MNNGWTNNWNVGHKRRKVFLPDRESNPGLPRDRRRSSPLDYRGIDGSAAGPTVQRLAFSVRNSEKNIPSSRIWTSDLWMSVIYNYSPPLYQLSYRGLCGIFRQQRHPNATDAALTDLDFSMRHIQLLGWLCHPGDVAQMVERSLSMWEVGGSIPPVSKTFSSLLFTNIACNHAWVGSMWLLNYYQRKKVCIVRESNPGRPRGRRAFYHWTNDARYPTRLSGTTWQWVHKWDLRNMCSKWLQLKQKKDKNCRGR